MDYALVALVFFVGVAAYIGNAVVANTFFEKLVWCAIAVFVGIAVIVYEVLRACRGCVS